MATLQKFSRFTVKLNSKSVLGSVTSVRNHWNKDFKPAPFPATQKEREASAKKYGIPIEQYQPYPDDGLGFGDYPKLKDESVEARDPNYPYDYPEYKRNFQEPIHAEIDLYSEDRWNNTRPRYPAGKMWLGFFGIMAFWAALNALTEPVKMFRPVLPKANPADGKKHYAYDSKDHH